MSRSLRKQNIRIDEKKEKGRGQIMPIGGRGDFTCGQGIFCHDFVFPFFDNRTLCFWFKTEKSYNFLTVLLNFTLTVRIIKQLTCMNKNL